jgi:hypothetical protein
MKESDSIERWKNQGLDILKLLPPLPDDELKIYLCLFNLSFGSKRATHTVAVSDKKVMRLTQLSEHEVMFAIEELIVKKLIGRKYLAENCNKQSIYRVYLPYEPETSVFYASGRKVAKTKVLSNKRKEKAKVIKLTIPESLFNAIQEQCDASYLLFGPYCKVVLATNLDYRSPGWYDDRVLGRSSMIGIDRVPVGISIPVDLLEEIDRAAKESKAARTAWIRHCLMNEMRKKEKELKL